MMTDLSDVRALGLVSSRKNLLTWSSNSDAAETPQAQSKKTTSALTQQAKESKLVADSASESSEAEEEAPISLPPSPRDAGNTEEMDYLALDLVQVLPMEKVTALLDNLRRQDTMVQNLLEKNYALGKENKRLKNSEVRQKTAKFRSSRPSGMASGASSAERARLLERLEWALQVNDTPSSVRAQSESKATESSASTEPGTPEEQILVESLQATVKQVTETNQHLQAKSQQLQEQIDTLTAELQKRTASLDAANEEIKKLKAPRTYSLNMTPARYRGRQPTTSSYAPPPMTAQGAVVNGGVSFGNAQLVVGATAAAVQPS